MYSAYKPSGFFHALGRLILLVNGGLYVKYVLN